MKSTFQPQFEEPTPGIVLLRPAGNATSSTQYMDVEIQIVIK